MTFASFSRTARRGCLLGVTAVFAVVGATATVVRAQSVDQGDHTFPSAFASDQVAFASAQADNMPVITTVPAEEAGPDASDIGSVAPSEPVVAGPPAGEFGPELSDTGSHVEPAIAAQPVGETFGPPATMEPNLGSGGVPGISWANAPASVPPALQRAIQIITESDPASIASWWRVRGAGADMEPAQWQRFPSVTVDGNLSGRSNWLLPSLTVDAPIWSAGRIGANIARARIAASSAEAGWEEVLLDLALLTSDTYFDIVLNTRLEVIYEESLAAHRELVGTMERRVAQRISAQADLQLAQSRTAQMEQDLLITQSQRDTALQTLAELIRNPDFQLGTAPEYSATLLADDWTDVIDQALAYSPTRQRLSLEAQVSEQDIRLARSAQYPQVSAQYAYNDVTGGRIGLGIRMQTGNGLSRLSEIDAARARYETATNQTRLFERQLRQELSAEVTANRAALLRTDVSRRAAMTATWVADSYVRQFIAGRRSWLDVMNSLREDLTAQSGQLQAEITAMATNVRLNLRSGRWRPERATGE